MATATARMWPWRSFQACGFQRERRPADRGDRVFVQTTDSDAVARHFLAATAAHDVEIVAHNLEDVC
jgi:hypothetical protein